MKEHLELMNDLAGPRETQAWVKDQLVEKLFPHKAHYEPPANRSVSYVVDTTLKALPGYPWLNPCPRCGFRGSCDCTVFERARAAHPTLLSLTEVLFKN